MAPQSWEKSNLFEKDRKQASGFPQVPAKTAFCELTPVKSGSRLLPCGLALERIAEG
jgi:hypothetical protein